MYQDLRDFLEQLGKKGRLLRVQKEVDVRFHIAAGIRKISDSDGPALLFENIKGYPGWRVLGGLFGTQELTALALGLPADSSEEEILKRYLEFDEKRLKPKRVATGPVKEVILKGEDVDLAKLPIATYSEKDVGPYITCGVEIARHPEEGFQNVSIHRRRVIGRDRTGIDMAASQHLRAMVMAAEEKGQGLGIATVIGADPALTVASQVKAPFGVDETEIAGALKGEPIEVVKCETIDVDVPARAEMVIEGVIVRGERTPCGPFGEYPGNYITSGGAVVREFPVIKVTAITMRKDAIFQAMLTGMPMTENHWLKKWALAAAAYREASKLADVKAVNVSRGGAAALQVIVAIKKRHEMEPRNIIAVLLSHRLGARQVIVVDTDINVYDAEDVEWAVATRALADKDIVILPSVSRGPLEPTIAERMSSRWGIDATMPFRDREYYQKIYVPGVEKVDYA